MAASLEALIAAIDQDPDDDARYLVLADALITAGDPRGELIVVQHELARRPHDAALARAEAVALHSAWGELAPLRRYFHASTWRLGFLDALELHAHMPRDGVVALGRAPESRWLRSLAFRSTWRNAPSDLTGLANLRTLVVADAGDSTGRRPRGPDPGGRDAATARSEELCDRARGRPGARAAAGARSPADRLAARARRRAPAAAAGVLHRRVGRRAARRVIRRCARRSRARRAPSEAPVRA